MLSCLFIITAADGKLEYCLNSLVGQTLQDMEIIAVDDCSTDQSWDILLQFEKNTPAASGRSIPR